MNPFHKKYIKTYVVPTESPDFINDETESTVTTFSSDKIVSIASGHIYQCLTAAAIATKEITISDMKISPNVTFEIFFANGNTASSPVVSINGETGKTLKIWSGGTKKTVPKDIDAGVTLRVFDDGTDLIVLGNPIIKSVSEYQVFADGRIEYHIRKVVNANKYEAYAYQITPQQFGLTTFANRLINISATEWTKMADIQAIQNNAVIIRFWNISSQSGSQVTLLNSDTPQELLVNIS